MRTTVPAPQTTTPPPPARGVTALALAALECGVSPEDVQAYLNAPLVRLGLELL